MKKKYIYVISFIIVVILLFSMNRANVFSVVRKQLLSSLGIYTEEVKNVKIKSSNYSNPGSFMVNKSVEWSSYGTARVSLDVNSIVKSDGAYKDIILLLPSILVSYDFQHTVTKHSNELIDYLLSESNNHISIVSYSNETTNIYNFSNDKDKAKRFVESIQYFGTDDYNAALTGALEAMNDYTKDDDHEVIALFITDSVALNEGSEYMVTYNNIKNKYPYIKFYGVMYDRYNYGEFITDDLERFAEKIWKSSLNDSDNSLLEAVLDPFDYDKFIVDYYIDNQYFTIDNKDDIAVGMGTVSLEKENGNQKIIWDLSDTNFYTGGSTSMTVDLKLKSEYLEINNYFPLDEKIDFISKVSGDGELTLSNNNVLVLKNMYNVIYDTNLPDGCNTTYTSPVSYGAFQNVVIDNDNITCDDYLFKGWEFLGDDKTNITMVNDEVFIMPTHDVTLRATWARPTITKSINGTVYERPTLYRVLENKSKSSTGEVKKFTGNHQDSINGDGDKEIYYFTGENSNNVIFANHCWKIIRTTDTGGVKLFYNGEVDSSLKCGTGRPKHVGYSSTTKQMSGSYYYSTDYTYDENTKLFMLNGDKIISSWNETTSANLIGKYTCLSENVNTTCSELQFIVGYSNSTTAHVLSLNSNSSYEKFGSVKYNLLYDSIAYAGYMYNKAYSGKHKTLATDEVLKLGSLSTNYWYADSVTYDSGKYYLVNPYKVSSSSDYKKLVGKYSFFNTSETASASVVNYITGVDIGYARYMQITGGKGLTETGNEYTYGTSYSKKGNGAYYIDNPATLKTVDYYDNRDKLVGKYVCKNASSNSCSEIWYVPGVSDTTISYNSIKNVYRFSTGISGNGTQYTLTGNYVDIWDFTSSNIGLLKQNRYTCLTASGTCSDKAKYIYRFDGEAFYYLDVTENIDISKVLSEMIDADDVNATDSIIKIANEEWYEKYLKNYTSYLEDTIYCNDRAVNDRAGWSTDVDDFSSYFKFRQFNSGTDLTCINITDKFSVNNSKAKLKYPVGLITLPELELVNINNFTNSSTFYTMTPSHFKDYVFNSENVFLNIFSIRFVLTYQPDMSFGLRPVVSLRPDIEYTTGDGTADNPYVIDTSS